VELSKTFGQTRSGAGNAHALAELLLSAFVGNLLDADIVPHSNNLVDESPGFGQSPRQGGRLSRCNWLPWQQLARHILKNRRSAAGARRQRCAPACATEGWCAPFAIAGPGASYAGVSAPPPAVYCKDNVPPQNGHAGVWLAVDVPLRAVRAGKC
jgi:hypothetical protein